ncbi:hypothetical protein ANN_09884 [Periplaneta americana]|uniref:DDE 3 domain-containing protein n=1 Tax=Periplaneta americana TaxID=6978 RepID=A0ABQ8TQ64_PERAM|nr:hypothetical protein ANN_09884 [Periplaneta americana]
MESARIVAWHYNYLQRLNKLRSEGSQIVFLDETWYDTHDVVQKGWDDGAIKFPTLRSSVKDTNFMQYHKIPVPYPIPIEAAMMQTIRKANINKTYIVDKLAASYGHEVRLPPYHCVLNPIKLVWARLKSHVRKNNTTPTLSASVCEHLRGVENINSNLWSSCVDHTIKVGERYWIQDTTGDGEHFIVDLRESDTDDE